MDDERSHDHAEREEDDLVALGERAAAVDRQRHGQGGRQRDGAPHARPRDDQGVLPWRVRLVRAEEVARAVGEGEDPHQADDHHHARDERSLRDQLAQRAIVEPLDDQRELQADQDEERGVEEEDQDLPDGDPLDPGGRGRELGGEPAHVDADGHGGEHA